MAVSSPSLPLLLLLLIASSSSAEPSGGGNDEVLALQSMRNLLEDPHGVLRDWNPVQVNPCTYAFVTCSVTCSNDNLVVSLKVPSRNLSGRLSPSIGNLTSLQSLRIWGKPNRTITGTIPAEIGKLRGLKKLDLSSNHLHGEIPSTVFHLESLQYLDLSYNNLSGPIQRSFAGTLYVVGNPLICGENIGQDCSSSGTASSQASLRTAKTKSHKFVVAVGSTVACIIFLFLPICMALVRFHSTPPKIATKGLEEFKDSSAELPMLDSENQLAYDLVASLQPTDFAELYVEQVTVLTNQY
ncbi:LRR receptor kinase SERL2-like [Miscanthus floridulus]|uniref:LRR receptor kinase SERL2-like n=1 Tax=Miscanthus floridulus TaxID=154761 RepID=UPI003457F2D5